MLRFCLLVGFFFLMHFSSFCQSLSINGIVTDQRHQPVRGATVHLLNTNQTSLTNENGMFVFTGLAKGSYLLSVSAVAYATQQQAIDVLGENFITRIQLNSTYQQLDAVTVTAEKKETDVQQLPLSVSTLSSKDVENYRLWNSRELTAIVPSLYADNSGDGRNVTSVRGIVTTSYDPAVATYIDGVNQFSLDTYISTLTDVERIEVLRGPQGTLYGRNAMGGVINIITRQPTNKTDGFAEVNVGNHGLQRYNLGFRMPLIKDKLFAGASFLFNKTNGYYTNDFNGSHFDKQQLFYGNYFLKYLFLKKWMMTANLKHQSARNNGAFPLALPIDEAVSNAYHINQNAIAKMIDNNLNASLVITHSGSEATFQSISSYQANYRYYNAPLDGDFSPLDVVSVINNYGKKYNNVKVLTQEFRLASHNDRKRLQYTAGALFFYQHNPVKQGTYYGEFANAAYGIGDSLFAIVNTSTGIGTGTALYGQLEYKISSRFVLTGGIRYDYEHRKLSVQSEYQKGDFGATILPDTSAKTHFDAVSPKGSLQYFISRSSNVYVTYSRGYRVGGLSPIPSDPSGPVTLSSYSPENSNSFEAGSKNVFFKNRLSLNITAFATFVNNAQVPTLVLPDAVTVIKNTGKLQTRGIEAEMALLLLKGLRIDYNAGIVHAEYKSLKIAGSGEEINLDGKKQIYTPAATSLLAAQYNIAIGKESTLFIRGEWQYKGKMYFDFANTIEQEAYGLLHARAGIETKHVGLYVWCRNLSDKKYIAYAYDFGAAHLGENRTFGVTIKAKL